jgi:hypothetical protein
LAEGAAIPPLPTRANSRSSRCATGCEGQRIPTESWLPVTAFGTSVERLRMSVSGPGQKRSASQRAGAGHLGDPFVERIGMGMWTINGWSAGRPFNAKMRATATGLRASAPRP